MATSPNFNWPEPDNTDLVKNGALAIRTAVDAIDTSLVDLKGGTTGQVLAKASGTDMDFSWVAQDDSNAIQNAIVDAKGDLIAASAADTPARLAVGSDYSILQSLASASLGMQWAGKISTYTPVWESSGTAPSLGNGAITGRYVRVGDLCFFYINVTMGTTTTYGTGVYYLTLPFSMTSSNFFGSGYSMPLNDGIAWYHGYFPSTVVYGLTNKVAMIRDDGTPIQNNSPFTFGTNDQILVWGSYIVA
jgi:hypothetical protein